MTIREKAKKFLLEHPYMEPDLCYQHGYVDGYEDARKRLKEVLNILMIETKDKVAIIELMSRE